MENLKKKVEEILGYNKIDFSLNYHHKGHEINIEGADEINDELESWIGYNVLLQYLIGREIVYDFSGSFILKDEKIVICISFQGPYEGEFESVELPIESIFSNKIIKKEIENVISSKVDYSEIYVEFGYNERDDLKYLRVNYWNENGEFGQLIEKLSIKSISYLKCAIKEFAISNVPCLNLPPEIVQYCEVECEENRITYYINTSEIYIAWDEIEN